MDNGHRLYPARMFYRSKFYLFTLIIGSIHMGDSAIILSCSSGSVRADTVVIGMGYTVTLRSELYVSELMYNLTSISVAP